MQIINLNDEPHCSPRLQSENPIHFYMEEKALLGEPDKYRVTEKTGFIIYTAMNFKTALIFCVDVNDLDLVTIPDIIVLKDKENKLFKGCSHINPRILSYVLNDGAEIRVYNIHELAECYEAFSQKYFHILFLSGKAHYPDINATEMEMLIEYADANIIMEALLNVYREEMEASVLGSGVNTLKDQNPKNEEPIDTNAVVYDGMIDYKGQAYILTDTLKEEE